MEGNLIFFTTQWFTIQPDLFGRIEDEVGELGESEKEFVRICTTALNSGRFEKYRWCGNGHPPSSRVAIFKMLVLKALRNFPTTKDTLLIIRQSPVLRRLCGWESVADVPSESTVSRAYDQFAQDEIASLVHADFVQAALGRNGVFHVSHDSSAIDAREKGQRKPQTEEEKPELRTLWDRARVQPSARGARRQVRPRARKQEGVSPSHVRPDRRDGRADVLHRRTGMTHTARKWARTIRRRQERPNRPGTLCLWLYFHTAHCEISR